MLRDPCAQHEPEAALALSAALVPQFMTLRRLLAQLGGLVLLSDGRRSETRDGIAVSLAALRADLAEVGEALAHAADRRHTMPMSLHRLQEAADAIGQSLAVIESRVLPSRQSAPDGLMALRRLQHAQRLLLSIADERRGFIMVGFSHACCCGPGSATNSARRCA